MDSYSIQLFGNIFAPFLSGLFLFILFLYFRFVENSQSTAVKYFRVFLLSFSIFLLSRPLQIFMGPHPRPLIINSLRMMLYNALTIPMVILTDFNRHFKTEKKNVGIVIGAGFLMGMIYAVFNYLTTLESQIVFTIGELVAYDNLTPSSAPPYYGREVTIGVSVVIGLILFADSIRKLSRDIALKTEVRIKNKKSVVYNIGKLIFALSYITGLLTKQWWIYYIGSIPSVCFLGMGVVIEIRDNKIRMDKVSAYIREDVIQNISLNQRNHDELAEMVDLLSIPRDINTFMILKPSKAGRIGSGSLHEIDHMNNVAELLGNLIDADTYILLRIGTGLSGICLQANQEGSKFKVTRIAEAIRESLEKDLKLVVDIGIGRTYQSLEELNISYHEAMLAADFASANGGGQVVHIEDIQNESAQSQYPVKEKDSLISAIRLGDAEGSERNLKAFIRKLLLFGENSNTLLKIRMYELIGSIIDAAIAGGGDVEELFALSRKLYEEAEMFRTLARLEGWLLERSREIVAIVKKNHLIKTNTFVEKAKKFIEENYRRQITVKDVANSGCISESYLKSVFRKSCGYSYSEYITKVRIDKAKELLASTDTSVTEIAYDVGYQSPNAFSVIFKKSTGLTPSQFKKL